MKTVKFYTDSGRYMGWCKAKWDKWSEVKNWLRSGNTVIIKGAKYDFKGFEHAMINAIHDNGNV